MKNMAIVAIVGIVILAGPGYAHCEGLDTLIEVARSQGDIAKAYSEETKAYENVKFAIEKGRIVKGVNKKVISDKYGEPVVIVGEYGTDREKWMYKPKTSDFFNGPKISLFFTKDGVLDDILVEK